MKIKKPKNYQRTNNQNQQTQRTETVKKTENANISFKTNICSICKKLGHRESYCHLRNKDKRPTTNQINCISSFREMESSDEEENQEDKKTKEDCLSLKTSPNDARIFIGVEIIFNSKKKALKRLVDTGSTITIIKGLGGTILLLIKQMKAPSQIKNY
jgi:hypothetical protein